MRPVVTALLLAVVLVVAGAVEARAETVHSGHAMAMHGEPKYPPNFEHFDYVNPDAPKGGTLRLGVTGTFDSFNPFVTKGNAFSDIGVETLTTGSADEPFTRYGLIAESMEWPEDRSSVTFTLRPEARWHDGTPITVEDVIFSLETLKTKGQPFYRFYYGTIDRAEKVGERTVKFVFNEAGNRELPLIAGEMPILSKAYWEDRDFERSSLEPPLTSGPYKVAEFEPGRTVVVERVEDYWGKDLPVNVGQDNFDRIRYDYFRDDTVLRQALKAGVIDYRNENQAKAWALDYDVPAVRDGWLKKEAIGHHRPTGMQAFIFNTRRPIFSDPKVREALAYAFDFEWSNRTLFFDQYARTESYFSNSDLASSGLPEGEELQILEKYRGRIPDAVFTEEYRAPATDGSGWPRANLEKAFDLLAEAGYEVRDMQLVDVETGEPMRFEILLVNQAFERVVLPFVRNLKRLGIDVNVRLVDESQYINRARSYDFDMIVGGWGQSESPGNEQRSYWTIRGGRGARLEKLRRHRGCRRRRTGGADHFRARSRKPGGPHARARPRVAVGVLRHSELAPARRPRALLGQVRAARGDAGQRDVDLSVVVRSGEGGAFGGAPDRCRRGGSRRRRHAGCRHHLCLGRRSEHRRLRGVPPRPAAAPEPDTLMTAYIIRRLLLIIPTLLAIMVINFVIIQTAPGGPVEQVIAQLTGEGADITQRITRSGSGETLTPSPSPITDTGTVSKYRGAQGLDPEFIKQLEKQFGFDKPLHERFFAMMGNYVCSISARATSATRRWWTWCWKRCRCRSRSGCGRH